MSEQYPSVPRSHVQLELSLTELGILCQMLFSLWVSCQENDPGIPKLMY